MSSSDARMFENLEARVAAIEAVIMDARLARMQPILAKLREDIDALLARVAPKDVSPELYGAEPDHGADREARAALLAKRRDRG